MPEAPNIKPNFFYAVVSVTILLTLLGLFGLLIMQGRYLINAYKEKIEIIVEVKDGTTFGGLDTLKYFISKKEFTKPNSVRFISKEEGASMMQREFGEEFLKLDMPIPLYDIILFNLRASYLQQDSIVAVRDSLRAHEWVSDVYYQEDVTTVITSNLNKVSYALLAAGVVFLIVAIVLILNTIRLSLYANRFIIKNMELVGASWDFISRPYLIKSMFHGLLSAILACGIISILLYILIVKVPEMREVINLSAVGLLFGILTVLGIVISVVSTYYVVRRYLRMRVDDLY